MFVTIYRNTEKSLPGSTFASLDAAFKNGAALSKPSQNFKRFEEFNSGRIVAERYVDTREIALKIIRKVQKFTNISHPCISECFQILI